MVEMLETASGGVCTAPDRLAFVRQIDQLIASRHHAGLRYPPVLLARALLFNFRGEASERAARLAWTATESADAIEEAAAAQFVDMIAITPPLRPGVASSLEKLHLDGVFIYVVTEGSLARVTRTIAHYGLNPFIDRVLEAKKQPQLYKRLTRLAHANGFMVGDQLDRDIAPAKAAGLTTIYFEGGFTPMWAPDERLVRPDFRIRDFMELVPIVLRPAHAYA
jgi:putative hydrolase of the HAD superfamily